jgi:transposase
MRKRRIAMGPKHTTEFRHEAVRVALTSGLARKQVATDFGVGFSTLSRWVQQDRQALPGPSVQSDLERETPDFARKTGYYERRGKS